MRYNNCEKSVKEDVRLKNLKPFKKGHDPRRNVNGAPPKIPQLDVLLADLFSEEKDGMTAAMAMLKAQRAKAIKGDTRAFEALFNRGYGNNKMPVELTGANGEPIQTEEKKTWFIALKEPIEDKPKRKYTRKNVE